MLMGKIAIDEIINLWIHGQYETEVHKVIDERDPDETRYTFRTPDFTTLRLKTGRDQNGRVNAFIIELNPDVVGELIPKITVCNREVVLADLERHDAFGKLYEMLDRRMKEMLAHHEEFLAGFISESALEMLANKSNG